MSQRFQRPGNPSAILRGDTGDSFRPSKAGRLCRVAKALPPRHHLVISPFAKQNNVDHTVNDQTSILRFIEDNWGLPRIGDQSFDALANSILGHLEFTMAHTKTMLLNPSVRRSHDKSGN